MNRFIMAFLLGFSISFSVMIVFQTVGSEQTSGKESCSNQVKLTELNGGGQNFDCGDAELKVPSLVCPDESEPVEITNIPARCDKKKMDVEWFTESGVKLKKNGKEVQEGKKLPLSTYQKVMAIADTEKNKQNLQIKASVSGGGEDCEDCGTAKDTTDVGCKLEITKAPSEMVIGETETVTVAYRSCGSKSASDSCDMSIDFGGNDSNGSELSTDTLTFEGGKGTEDVEITPHVAGERELSVDGSNCNCGREQKNITVRTVKLVPRSRVTKPDISPKIASNAQSEYKIARWGWQFKPDDINNFEATVTSPTKNVNFSKRKPSVGEFKGSITINEGSKDSFWVKVKGGITHGDYEIKIEADIKSNSTEKLTAKNSSKIFLFKHINSNVTCGPTTSKPYKSSSCNSTEPRFFDSSVQIDMPFLGRPKNGTVKQKAVWNYKVSTLPRGEFEGTVTMPTEIEVSTSEGSSIGARSDNKNVKTTFKNKLIISGLQAGNATRLTQRVAQTATGSLELDDEISVSGLKTTYDNDEALYEVGKEVKVEDIVLIEVDRNDSTTNYGWGEVGKDGFSLDTGEFVIESKGK